MAAFESWFRQDLKKPVAVRQLTGNLFSADNAANLIGVEILNDDAPAEISGAVMGYVIRSDGDTVLVQGTLEGNKCSVTLPSSCYAVIGRISIVIKLGTTTVLACTGYVYQASTDAIIDPGSVIPSISELLEKIDEMEQGTAAANTAAQNANTAATSANTAASKIDNMTVSASKLPEDASPTAQISEVSGHKHIAFGIPQGATQAEFDDLSEQVINKSPAIECSASGSIASFADGADGMPLRSLSVAIEPVQDLHGQDSPYPAGGGKNKLHISYPGRTNNGVTYTTNEDSTVSLSGTATDASYFAYNYGFDVSYMTRLTAGTYTLSGAPNSNIRIYGTMWSLSGTNIGGVEADTGNGSTFTCNEDIWFSPQIYVQSGTNTNGIVIKPQIEVGSSKTAYAPYSNICPISGFSEAKVTRTGKNIINQSELVYSEYGNNALYGTKLPPDTDFVFSTDSTITGLYVEYSDDDEMPSILGEGWVSITYKYNTTSLGFNSGSHKWYRLMTYEINDVIRDRLYQLELGSTATAYEPYQGNTYDITFPQSAGTVYGGTLTIHQDGSGELVVDHKVKTLVGNEFQSIEKDDNFYTDAVEDAKQQQLVRCSMFKSVYTYYVSGIVNIWISASRKINLTFPEIPHDVNALNTFLANMNTAGTPVQLVYELAEPISYTLTAAQVTTLLGVNNIWADTGNVSLKYPADTKLYIDGKIAEIHALILENISNS